MKKPKFKDVKKSFGKGAKSTIGFFKKYGPSAHAYFKGVSSSAEGIVSPRIKNKRMLGLTQQRRERVELDFSSPVKKRKFTSEKGRLYLDLR